MIKEVTRGEEGGAGGANGSTKRNYGLQEKEDSRSRKRPRVDDDDDDDHR